MHNISNILDNRPLRFRLLPKNSNSSNLHFSADTLVQKNIVPQLNKTSNLPISQSILLDILENVFYEDIFHNCFIIES
jgi:hypothetical protein